MSEKQSWLPWYRQKNYDGNLTEEEKRILDSFRIQGEHTAARNEDLPNEVQSYINVLELELYDLKQDSAANKAFALSAFAVFLIYLAYTGQAYSAIGAYIAGAIIVVLAWLGYRRTWNKNAEEFLPKSENAPNRTDEGIRKEWELDYNFRMRR